jgi:putative endonuclease
MMSFTVYVLYSASIDKYYIGHTENLNQRLFKHNNSGSSYTKRTNDWKVVYTEIFNSRAEAMKIEHLKKESAK